MKKTQQDYKQIDSMYEAHEYVMKHKSKDALDYFINKYAFMLMQSNYYKEEGLI